MSKRIFTAEICSSQIDAHESIPVLGARLQDGSEGSTTSARHQNVELATRLDGSIHQRGDCLFVGDISWHGNGSGAGLSTFLDNTIQRRPGPGSENDPYASPSEGEGGGTSYARTRTGNNGNPSVKLGGWHAGLLTRDALGILSIIFKEIFWGFP